MPKSNLEFPEIRIMSEDVLLESHGISTLYSFDTEYSADSVEWCPHAPHKNIFVCSNYQLIKTGAETTSRVGRILLFSITPEKGLELLQRIETAAVLDQKWCLHRIDDRSILGVVNAQKTLEIYELNTENLQLLLVDSYELIDDDTETLLLSLDWSTGKFDSNEPEIVVSDSKGNIHRWKFVDNHLVLEATWHGHDYEAWIAGFYYWDTNIIFSGGDDSVLLKFDKRMGDCAVAKNRLHEAGVTSFHSNKSEEFLVATGSYDQSVRLWDMRRLKNPINSIKMPGPVWRLKWDPFKQDYLLAACMLGGVHVIKARNVENLEIVESYYEHKDISYGADWSHLLEDDVNKFECAGNAIIGTCSFYDHLMCVAKLTCELT